MREVAVLGVGMTKFGPSSLSLQELFAEAALEAIRESNLTSKDIQALVIGNVLGDFAEGQMNLAPLAWRMRSAWGPRRRPPGWKAAAPRLPWPFGTPSCGWPPGSMTS